MCVWDEDDEAYSMPIYLSSLHRMDEEEICFFNKVRRVILVTLYIYVCACVCS